MKIINSYIVEIPVTTKGWFRKRTIIALAILHQVLDKNATFASQDRVRWFLTGGPKSLSKEGLQTFELTQREFDVIAERNKGLFKRTIITPTLQRQIAT